MFKHSHFFFLYEEITDGGGGARRLARIRERLKCKEIRLLFKGAAVSGSSGLVGGGATHLASIHPCKAPRDRSEVLDSDTSEVK